MARVGTTKFNFGMHEQGDNPGAGSQDESTYASNTGLNGDRAKLEKALQQHKTDGTHEDDVIDGRNLKNTALDGATLEFSASTGVKVGRIKALGVGTAQVADGAITLAKHAADSVDNTILKDDASVDINRAVTTNHLRDGLVTNPKIGPAAVDSSKCAAGVSEYMLFCDARVAGTALGNTTPIDTEWQATSLTNEKKISVWYLKRPGDKYVKLSAFALTADVTKPWKVTLDWLGGSVSTTGTNTSYGAGAAAIVVLNLDISSGADGSLYEIGVYLAVNSGTAVCKMTRANLMVVKV